jgi:hypothetical protein
VVTDIEMPSMKRYALLLPDQGAIRRLGAFSVILFSSSSSTRVFEEGDGRSGLRRRPGDQAEIDDPGRTGQKAIETGSG